MRRVDLAVVGAGPAGLAAAARAAQLGAQVVLIDEQTAPGGHLRWTLAAQRGLPAGPAGQPGFRLAEQLSERLAGVEVLTGTVAWGLFAPREVAVAGPTTNSRLEAERIILATGSTDIVWPFRGWTLPGVMTSRAARILMHLHRVRPGRRAVIIGDDPQLAVDLELAGIELAARLPSPDGLTAGGEGRLEWVEYGGQRYAADLALFALGRQPDPELALHLSCDLDFSVLDGCHVPVRSATLETSVPGVYVVGDAAGICSTAQALAEGELAAEAALGGAGLSGAQERVAALRTERSPAVWWDVNAIPDDVLVDREEQISAAEIRQAIREGAFTVNDVKRRTRAGMGVAQGIYSTRTIAAMIHAQAGVPLEELTPMTARPPARLLPLEALAAGFVE